MVNGQQVHPNLGTAMHAWRTAHFVTHALPLSGAHTPTYTSSPDLMLQKRTLENHAQC